MALTPQQEKFLDAYVRQHAFKGKIKSRRAGRFSAARQRVIEALRTVPPDLPQRAALMQRMAEADRQAEGLDFNDAARAMDRLLVDLRHAVSSYKPPSDGSGTHVGDPTLHKRLRQRLAAILADKDPVHGWETLTKSPIGGNLKILAQLAGSRVTQQWPSAKDLEEAASALDELAVKRDHVLRRAAEIEKRRRQLAKYAAQLQGDQEASGSDAEAELAAQADALANKAAAQWTKADEDRATALYLDMMLRLASSEGVQQKNLKGNSPEIVLAVRRKHKLDQGTPDPDIANFKLVVKPIGHEIAVDGFQAGGGASREMMGAVVGDKLQEMLGLSLNVPSTRLVQLDGGLIGLDDGEPVTASVQAFVAGGVSLADEADKKAAALGYNFLDQKIQLAVDDINGNCSAQNVQELALFDLVSLHADRHYGNVLMTDDGRLVPIDHGNILPTKAGLRARAKEIGGPGHPVLRRTDAAQQPMAPEMVRRIRDLNIDDLVQSATEAKKAMARETPEADVGDLDEGISNMRRSAEFLKFSAGHLTLAEIYSAYHRFQDDIFFIDERNKYHGFQRVVEYFRRDPQVAKRFHQLVDIDLSVDPQVLRRMSDEDTSKLVQLCKAIQVLGWFAGCSETPTDFVFQYPRRALEIIEKRLRCPPLPPVPANAPPMPEDMLGSDWVYARYLRLGGDAAANRRGLMHLDSFIERVEILETCLAVDGTLL